MDHFRGTREGLGADGNGAWNDRAEPVEASIVGYFVTNTEAYRLRPRVVAVSCQLTGGNPVGLWWGSAPTETARGTIGPNRKAKAIVRCFVVWTNDRVALSAVATLFRDDYSRRIRGKRARSPASDRGNQRSFCKTYSVYMAPNGGSLGSPVEEDRGEPREGT